MDKRSSMPRQREELVAHYWQRFCVKNDTIGFFGPVGWGRWDAATSGIALGTGSGLVAESTVYWASWGIDALARTLDADPDLREWIAPRRVPFVTVDGYWVRMPGRKPVAVPAETAASSPFATASARRGDTAASRTTTRPPYSPTWSPAAG